MPSGRYNRAMPTTHQQIEAWKARLLDLGRRNRLLHTQPGRAGTVALTAPPVAALFDALAPPRTEIGLFRLSTVSIGAIGNRTGRVSATVSDPKSKKLINSIADLLQGLLHLEKLRGEHTGAAAGLRGLQDWPL